MSLSINAGIGNGAKRGRLAYHWGGCPNFTPLEKEAINALREDDDNINSLVFCCLDPLTGDIYVFAHNCDPTRDLPQGASHA